MLTYTTTWGRTQSMKQHLYRGGWEGISQVQHNKPMNTQCYRNGRKEPPSKLATRSLIERFQAHNIVMNFRVIKTKMPNPNC